MGFELEGYGSIDGVAFQEFCGRKCGIDYALLVMYLPSK